MDEHTHQKIVVDVIRRDYPDVLIFAIPNGGHRSPAAGARLKDEGVLAGVPDLMVAYAAHGFHGLFVEMKTEKGRVSKEQEAVIADLRAAGYRCEVCHGYAEALAVIRAYLGAESTQTTGVLPIHHTAQENALQGKEVALLGISVPTMGCVDPHHAEKVRGWWYREV